jgi:PAS domain S-box-containing protein
LSLASAGNFRPVLPLGVINQRQGGAALENWSATMPDPPLAPADPANIEARLVDRRFWVLPLSVFAVALLVTASIGLLIFHSAKRSVTAYVNLNLSAVAHLKAEQVAHSLEEVEENLEFAVDNGSLLETVREWRRAGGGEGALKEHAFEALAKLCAAPEAIECSLHSPDDGALWISNGFGSDSDVVRAQASVAARQVEPQPEDFLVQQRGDLAHANFGFFYGVRDHQPMGPPEAVIHVTINPAVLFLVLGGQLPELTTSAESVLLDRDGMRIRNTARNASEGTRSNGAAATQSDLNFRAVRGEERSLRGVDNRGIPVLAYAVRVPLRPWFVLTKIDQAEAYSQINTISILAAGTLLALMTTGCISWSGRRRYLSARDRDRVERMMLIERIDYLARYANDCIILTDADGRILEINDRCLSTYGYSAAELIGMHLADLDPSIRIGEGALMKLREPGGLIYETEHRRKDGQVIPVEISARIIATDGRRCMQAIVRDITERRRLEAERSTNLKRFKELSHRMILAQEQERRRISADLHDRTGANLEAIKLNLSAILKPSQARSPVEADSLASETFELLAEALAEIREFCVELRPSILDHDGLIPALEYSAHHFSRRTGIEVLILRDDFDQRFARDVESVLFRIAQEALTNCAKHSQAKIVTIDVGRSGGRASLTVTDDGLGFEVDQLGGSENSLGLGLSTMRERAEFAGGRFDVTSRPGYGTQIRVQIDIEEDAAWWP